jgi:hypothetical protein
LKEESAGIKGRRSVGRGSKEGALIVVAIIRSATGKEVASFDNLADGRVDVVIYSPSKGKTYGGKLAPSRQYGREAAAA